LINMVKTMTSAEDPLSRKIRATVVASGALVRTTINTKITSGRHSSQTIRN